uniref:Uncharacterized protein n=1 Tax=Picea sitchensis TaxID=3332 RepID=D5AAC0_PICSI|nr:unknown [Picea sitchensis]
MLQIGRFSVLLPRADSPKWVFRGELSQRIENMYSFPAAYVNGSVDMKKAINQSITSAQVDLSMWGGGILSSKSVRVNRLMRSSSSAIVKSQCIQSLQRAQWLRSGLQRP